MGDVNPSLGQQIHLHLLIHLYLLKDTLHFNFKNAGWVT